MNDDTLMTTTASHIIGFIEAVDSTGVYGWAYDQANPQKPTFLQIFIDGIFEAIIECADHRPDVLAAGHSRADVGFRWSPSVRHCDGRPHDFEFRNPHGSIGLERQEHIPSGPFQFHKVFDERFYVDLYGEELRSRNISAVAHWRENQSNFGSLEEFLLFLERQGEGLEKDFSPSAYKFLNPNLVPSEWSDTKVITHYLKVGRLANLDYRIQDKEFFLDLYSDFLTGEEFEATRLIGAKEVRHKSLKAMLLFYGIESESILSRLNVSEYVALNPGFSLSSVSKCLLHFCKFGLEALTPLSFINSFDPVFYRDAYPHLRALSSTELYRNWLNDGIDAGRAPNAREFLRSLGLRSLRDFPTEFNIRLYRLKNPGLPEEIFESRWTALKHFVEFGLEERREGCDITSNTAEIYRIVADRLAINNRLQAAKSLYEAVLSVDPANTLGLRHYGDCLLRLGEPFLSASVYQQTIAARKDTAWTHLNLARSLKDSGRLSESVEVIGALCQQRPGDQGLKRELKHAIQSALDAVSRDASWLACNDFHEEARALLKGIYRCIEPYFLEQAQPTRSALGITSVLILADLGLPQCKLYRVDQKSEQLKRANIGSEVFDFRSEIGDFLARLPSAQAVIFYRLPATLEVLEAIGASRAAGLTTFFDIDDLMFEDECFPDSFESYGGQVSRELYSTLVTGTVALRAAIRLCDFGIASTPPLSRALEVHVRTGMSFVHPNGLSDAHQRAMSRRVAPRKRLGRSPVRIFYGSGTKAHNDDFELLIAPALSAILEKHGSSVQVIIMGYVTLPASLSQYMRWITIVEPIWDVQRYWDILSGIDINVAVLNEGRVTDCKSEIKWLEAAMFGIPSVVSSTETYREVLSDWRDGVLVRTTGEWFEALDRLISDGELREEIGAAAQRLALTKYAPASLSDNLASILSVARLDPDPDARRMRVLVVNVFYPPQSIGGATRVVADNIKDLREQYGSEFEFEVFTTIEGSIEPYLERVYVHDGVRVFGVTTPSEPDIERKTYDQRMARSFEKHVGNFKPDIIHFHCIQRITPAVGDVAVAAGIPYIVTVHDGWWISDHQFLVDQYGNFRTYDFNDHMGQLIASGQDDFIHFCRKKEFLDRANVITAVSAPFAEIYKACGFDNVKVVENGVSDFKLVPRRASPTGRVRLAHIGGASAHKGYDLLRAAFWNSDYRNLELLIIDHALEPGVESASVWGSSPVKFRGKVPQEDIGSLYAEIDVLLCLSIWPESYGLVAREAMLAGCWVVASDRGAIGSDVNPGKNGFIVDVTTTEAISFVLEEMNRVPGVYCKSPPQQSLRSSTEQAVELTRIYRSIVAISGTP